mmetsp:Transcript_45998/g.33760  ORF Transcript_45998/g.33760 Transcript_45998/m.33760 type:complete len:111 (-) Transcript_45998:246-578(-)
MTEDMKRLMYENSIVNEGELFCSNLSFRGNGEVGQKYVGDPSKKEEDVVALLNTKLENMRKKYLTIFKEEGKGHEGDYAKALYFATYYDKENNEYHAYEFEHCLSSEPLR